MLQQFAIEGHDSWTPSTPVKCEGISICVMCEDAIALYHELKGRRTSMHRGRFVGNGLWVTSITDPDGFRIDFENLLMRPKTRNTKGLNHANVDHSSHIDRGSDCRM